MSKNSIIKYIIENIDDKLVNKIILYDVTMIQEVKQRFVNYVKKVMREKVRQHDGDRNNLHMP